MHAHLIPIGNSRGVRLPKALIDQAGLEDEIEILVTDGVIIIRPVRRLRAGWSEAAKACHANGDDGILLDGFGNSFDAEW
jgi:antitoxin MazE